MGISKNLFRLISLKLKLETFRIREEYEFAKKLSEVSFNLSESKKKNRIKTINNEIKPQMTKKCTKLDESFSVSNIITISFLKANTIIHLSDSKGKILCFFTAGNVNLSGKQKTKRGLAVLKLMALMSKKFYYLILKAPVALHLNNVVSHKSLIVKKLKEKFFIKVIKSFNLIPYNGCRKKKLRRKKKIKNIFK